jgi:zinc D-Ala-D-Ala dipeptidase
MTVVAEEPVLLCDPRVAEIAWADDGEPLVDLRKVVGLRLDRRLADPCGAFAHLRRGVVRRLLAAQDALPKGLELLVVEGYRPAVLQQRSFDDYAAELGLAHPDWEQSRRRIEASKFVSPPEAAPHGTGGAVDLTLCTTSGVELDLGTPVNASPEASDGACYTAAADIPAQARELRWVLGDALRGAGLVNYPTEWWHWSYGERYWALLRGVPVTRYAPVAPDLRQVAPAHPAPQVRAGVPVVSARVEIEVPTAPLLERLELPRRVFDKWGTGY